MLVDGECISYLSSRGFLVIIYIDTVHGRNTGGLVGMVYFLPLKTVQSISASSPYLSFNHSFASRKWPFPMKPLCADRGEG